MAASMRKFTRNTWRSLSHVLTTFPSTSRLLRVVLGQRTEASICSRCLCTHNTTTSRYNGMKLSLDKPQKRKILRQIKSEVYTKNASNSEMEKAARSRKLLVPLDEVKKGWIPKRYPHQVMTMASYYGIYNHMFDGTKFVPRVVMAINYGDNICVHYGNFIEPCKTSCEPQVKIDAEEGSLTTLMLVNFDGSILSENQDILHWMVGNIPDGNIKKGEVISGYLPPCPVKGTGFHRFVFCLLKQSAQCDFEEINRVHKSRNLVNRSFNTKTFLESFQSQLNPVGLSFFQATWDSTVTNTFEEMLGMKEPLYDIEPFLTPNQKKKLKVQDVFGKKYTNM